MNYTLHFLRPEWFFAIIPLILLAYRLLRQSATNHAWKSACDAHLLPHLLHTTGLSTLKRAYFYLLGAALCMIIGLAGPAGKQLPTPTYHTVHPRLVLLDLSRAMLKEDITPNRLKRAKFKLHDLFSKQQKGQFGLIAYTSEPFTVSPLTQDTNTIDALIDQLDPSIVPVDGTYLVEALKAGEDIIKQSGATYGDMLVITGTPPTPADTHAAKKYFQKQIRLSILPLTTARADQPAFSAFASAGGGKKLIFTHTEKDIEQWLHLGALDETFQENLNHLVPIWRDDGRWLLVPALLLLTPVFRRAWLTRVQS